MIGCRPLSPIEFEAVLKGFSGPFEHRDRLLFVLGCTSGFRISELLSLTIGDVWRHGKPLQRIKVRRCNMKGKHSSRSVTLTPFAIPYLERWLGDLALRRTIEPTTPLFASRKGQERSISRVQAYRLLTQNFAFTSLELPSNGTHTMRKTFAARVFEAVDRNIFLLQAAMGHASPASTVRYVAACTEEVDQAITSAWR